jgi:uncharacterized integral membrane protein
MRTVSLILKIVLFVLVLVFAARNTEVVTVRYFPGSEWQAPLVFVLLAVFAIGIVLGLGAALPRIVRQRREISALKRDLAASRKEAEARKAPAGGSPA